MPTENTPRTRSIMGYALICLAMLSMTSGCASVEVRESQRLDAVLAAAKGAPADEMARRLASHGYTCSAAPGAASSGTTALQCSSQRANLWPPYSCIFRVDLQPEPQAGAAGVSPVVSHVCAGL